MFHYVYPKLSLVLAVPITLTVIGAIHISRAARRKAGIRLPSSRASRKPPLPENVIDPTSLL